MGSEDRGCCDKCAKMFIMAINIVIVIIGGVILGAGIYWQLSEAGFYNEIFSHDIFNVPIISMTIGSLLLLVGLCGFIGACCETIFLLKVYMGFVILIMLAEIILAVGCVAMKDEVETAATENVKKMITYYGDSTKDEAGVITKALDLFQEQFDCCGVDGPSDWETNTAYETNKYVPNSCCLEAERDDDTCGNTAYSTNTKINKTGCKVALWNFVETNLLYVGIFAGLIVIIQVAILIMASKFRTTIEDEGYENW